jgi:hypothetical protein
MSAYEFIIKDKAGNALAVLDGARNRKYEDVLNGSGMASFSISAKDEKLSADLILPGNKELYIYKNGDLKWGGEIAHWRLDLDGATDQIMVTARGFLNLLDKKLAGSPSSPRVFTNTDAGSIAWTLIDESQAGLNSSFGITQGVIETTKNRDRTFEGETVKEAILSLSSNNIKEGFDFEVDANKQFSVYSFKGETRDDVFFEWGVNITSLFLSTDSTSMANQVLALGEGVGVEMVTATANSDTNLQEQYKVRQKKISLKTVSNPDTLLDHASKEISLTQAQQQIVGLRYKNVLDVSNPFFVGDSPRVKVKYGMVEFEQNLRVYAKKVNISDNDDEDIELVFNP